MRRTYFPIEIIPQIIGLIFLVPLLALAVFSITRRNPWALIWWLPLTSWVLAATAYLIFVVDDGLPMAPGPGGGGEGIIAMLVWGARAAFLALSIVCVVLAPRKPAWRPRPLVISLMISASPLWLLHINQINRQRTFNIRVVDAAGNPIVATVEYRVTPNRYAGLNRAKDLSGTCATDSTGIVSIAGEDFTSIRLVVTSKALPKRSEIVALYKLDQDGMASEEMMWTIPYRTRYGLEQKFHDNITGGKTWTIEVQLPVDNTIAPPFPYQERMAQLAEEEPRYSSWPHADDVSFANIGGFQFAQAVAMRASQATQQNSPAVMQLRAMLSVAGDADWNQYHRDKFDDMLKRGPLPPDQVAPVTDYLKDVAQQAQDFYKR